MAANQSGYEQYCKPTRRDEFLATMEAIVPWAALCEVIEPHYARAGNGHPPIGLIKRCVSTLTCPQSPYQSFFQEVRHYGK